MNGLTVVNVLGMGLPSALDDVCEEWGLTLMLLSNCNDLHKGKAVLVTVLWGGEKYSLLENGDIYTVTIKSEDNGHTFNGDDMYYKSFKDTFTFVEKMGSIDIKESVEYYENKDENIENVACQLIEFLSDF